MIILSALIKVAMQEQRLYRWCSALATRPDLQGNGFGTALMNIGYQKANYLNFRVERQTITYFLIPRPRRPKS
jgi:GNAT superfamily N-acetyltransferase